MENKVFEFLVRKLRSFGNKTADLFNRFISFGKQRFTVMFIPHSEKKIFNFKISVFALFFVGLLTAAALFSFFFYSTNFTGVSRMLSTKSEDLETSQAALNEIRDQIYQLLRVSDVFEDSWQKTMNKLYPAEYADSSMEQGGDLSSFINTEEQQAGTMREISGLRSLQRNLDDSTGDLSIVADKISTVEDLLADLPIFWPVEGGVGHISNTFGPAIHPFTHTYYLHKGLDISFRRGRPIVSAANGKIIECKSDVMFGNYIIVQHLGGYSTRYAHLATILVKEGDIVAQGQRIGTLGNTGLSTGPHLHFEVRLGSAVLDPEAYLEVRDR